MGFADILSVKRRTVYSRLIRSRKLQLLWADTSAEYLNAGCGEKYRPGFVNVEYWWQPGINLCWDLTKPLPFEAGTFKGIFTEHCLEHLPHEWAKFAVREFRRVLKPGGVCRVVLPDAGLYLNIYAKWRQGERIPFPFTDGDAPGWTPMAEVNLTMRRDGHLYGYDTETVMLIMREAGFSEAVEASFMQGRNPGLLIDSPERACESLYVEGVA